MTVTWCVPSDIRQNVAGTDQGTGTCAALTDDQITAVITQAASKVAAYTGTTWQPDASTPGPVTPPDLVKTMTVQIATFYATLVYRKGKDLSAFDPVYLGYLDAMRTLTDIAAGKIDISPATPGMADDLGGHVVNTISATFSHEDSATRLNPVTRRVEADTQLARGWEGGW